MAERQRMVMWRRMDTQGLEYCSLSHGGEGWVLEGTAVMLFDGTPGEARYSVVCDDGWLTRQALVSLDMGGRKRTLLLVADDERRWWLDGEEIAAVRGCVDVDLGVTPSTNTLPIRRLGLGAGESRDLAAAWVRFPSLEVRPLAQRYTRLDADRYRYESGDALASGGAATFTADLLVDDAGLVVEYANVWLRVATDDAERSSE